MIFADIPFPERIAMGAESDPVWSTNVVKLLNGFESANQNWLHTRHQYDVSFAVRTKSNYLLVRSHFHQMRGRGKSFPFKDFLDFEVSSVAGAPGPLGMLPLGVLLDIDGAAPAANGAFFFHARYGSGADAYSRKITRPVNPAQVFRTRAAVTTNITGAGAVVTHTTGSVAITGHAGGDTYAWSGEFMVPCRYDSDRLPAAAINKKPAADGELLVECGPIPIIEVREA